MYILGRLFLERQFLVGRLRFTTHEFGQLGHMDFEVLQNILKGREGRDVLLQGLASMSKSEPDSKGYVGTIMEPGRTCALM